MLGGVEIMVWYDQDYHTCRIVINTNHHSLSDQLTDAIVLAVEKIAACIGLSF